MLVPFCIASVGMSEAIKRSVLASMGHISRPVSIISRLNVCLKFWLAVPSDNLNTGKLGLA